MELPLFIQFLVRCKGIRYPPPNKKDQKGTPMGLFDKRKKKYENGDEYIGKLRGGKPDGFGTMHYADGSVYEGEWADGVRSGHGKWERKYDDGWTAYEGEWLNDEYSGQGTLSFYRKERSIETYEGQWKHNKLDGKVKEKTEYFDSGNTYEFEGEYVDGAKEGYGVYRAFGIEINIYEGYWSKGKFGGQGTFTVNDQVVTGIFDDYSRITNATIRYSNGDVYEGDVIMDHVLQNGEKCSGRMTYANGDVYEGEWLWTRVYEGAPDGWGTMTYYGNYLPYTGPWKNGETMSVDAYFGKSSSSSPQYTSQYDSIPVNSEALTAGNEAPEPTENAGNEAPEAAGHEAAKEPATYDLPKMTIATVGAPGCGKTTLTAAISKVLSVRYNTEYKPVTAEELDNRPEEQRLHQSIDTSVIEYRTDTRRYTHIDCPGRYFKNALCGIQIADAWIVVVSAVDGILRETRDFMWLCGYNTFVFLETAFQDDEEIIDLINDEIEEYGYKNIVIGCAQDAIDDPYGPAGDAILKLMEMIEKKAPIPERDTEGSLLLPIHKVYTFSEKGPIIAGRIESGTVRTGDTLELVSRNDSIYTVTAKEIQSFDKDVESARAGDYVGILLGGTFPKKIKRGQLLVTPGSRPCYEHLKVKVWLYKKIPLCDSAPRTYDFGADIQCWFGLISGVGTVLSCVCPGENEDYPEYSAYSDSDYPTKNLRIIDLFFMDLIPVRKNDEVIFIEHLRPVGYGTVLAADTVDPEIFFPQFAENAAARFHTLEHASDRSPSEIP